MSVVARGAGSSEYFNWNFRFQTLSLRKIMRAPPSRVKLRSIASYHFVRDRASLSRSVARTSLGSSRPPSAGVYSSSLVTHLPPSPFWATVRQVKIRPLHSIRGLQSLGRVQISLGELSPRGVLSGGDMGDKKISVDAALSESVRVAYTRSQPNCVRNEISRSDSENGPLLFRPKHPQKRPKTAKNRHAINKALTDSKSLKPMCIREKYAQN
jgi:hypothetical protein